MKKYALPLFLLAAFAGCSDNPFSVDPISMGSSGNIVLTVNTDKTITISESPITNAVITLVFPSGSVQTSTWTPGGPGVFYYTAVETGSYTLRVSQTDTSNNTLTTNAVYSFQKGYNYTISLTLGGAIFLHCNSDASSVSSAVSSSSSVSSSISSSVSSAGSSSSSSSSKSSSVSSSSSISSISSSSSSSSSSVSSSSSSSVSSVSSSSSSSSSDGITVYAAGKTGNGYAVYWIEKTLYDISDAAYSYATGIALSGTDVYVSGRRNVGYACYWKNGSPVTLSDHMLSVANDIFVSGNNVYAVGNYLTSWYPFQPMVWVNGTATSMGGRSLSGVAVDGSTLYISGQGGAATTVASYWIIDGSGTRQFNLTPDTNTNYSDTSSVAAANGNVYVAGNYYLSGVNNYAAVYWYGTAGTALNMRILEPNYASGTGKVCLTGSTLYIPGYYSNGANKIACYWVVNPGVSSVRVDLGTAGHDSTATSIAVVGSTIIAGGWQNNGTHTVACYWKNGARTDIGPADSDSYAEDIAAR